MQVSFICHIIADSIVVLNDTVIMEFLFFLIKDQQLLTESVPRSLGQGQHASGQGRPLQFPLLTPPVAAAERHGMYRVTDIHLYILTIRFFVDRIAEFLC